MLLGASEANPRLTIPIRDIPRFIPHAKPMPPDESGTTGQFFFQIRTNPPSPDHSDRAHPLHKPSVVGLIPTGPTERALLRGPAEGLSQIR
jgi:hypothetical protein